MHLMVDTETLGRNSHSPVIELAVVKFSRTQLIDSFTRKIRPSFHHSLPEVDTIAWWMQQQAEIPLNADAPEFPEILVQLGEWLGQSPLDGVWANAPSFDLVILHNLANAYNVKMPWMYRDYLDFRTLMRIGKKLGVKRTIPSLKHEALGDALAQAETVININRALGRGGIL